MVNLLMLVIHYLLSLTCHQLDSATLEEEPNRSQCIWCIKLAKQYRYGRRKGCEFSELSYWNCTIFWSDAICYLSSYLFWLISLSSQLSSFSLMFPLYVNDNMHKYTYSKSTQEGRVSFFSPSSIYIIHNPQIAKSCWLRLTLSLFFLSNHHYLCSTHHHWCMKTEVNLFANESDARATCQ